MKFVGTTAAARILGVSLPTVRALADRGDLRMIRTEGAGRRNFLTEDVVRLARERAEGRR